MSRTSPANPSTSLFQGSELRVCGLGARGVAFKRERLGVTSRHGGSHPIVRQRSFIVCNPPLRPFVAMDPVQCWRFGRVGALEDALGGRPRLGIARDRAHRERRWNAPRRPQHRRARVPRQPRDHVVRPVPRRNIERDSPRSHSRVAPVAREVCESLARQRGSRVDSVGRVRGKDGGQRGAERVADRWYAENLQVRPPRIRDTMRDGSAKPPTSSVDGAWQRKKSRYNSSSPLRGGPNRDESTVSNWAEHTEGYQEIFGNLSARVSVTLSVGAPICPYRLPTIGS